MASAPAASTGVRVRPAQPEDAQGILELLAVVARDTPLAALEAVPDDPEPLRAALGRMGDQGVVLVAEDGEPRGLVAVAFVARGPAPARHTANLSLAVARDSRRRGVGRALVLAAADWALAHDVDRLTASVASANASALALFTACGLAIEGRRPDHLAIGGALYAEILFGAPVGEVRGRRRADRARVVPL